MSLISGISAHSQSLLEQARAALQEQRMNPEGTGSPQMLEGMQAPQKIAESGQVSGVQTLHGAPTSPSFGDMIRNLVDQVDQKQKSAAEETRKVLSGESDNLHQSIIAGQESSVAFTLMVEVRNKLIESYQELMRMQV